MIIHFLCNYTLDFYCLYTGDLFSYGFISIGKILYAIYYLLTLGKF